MGLSRVWLITGANKGLGLELALKALEEGDRVVAVVRTPSSVPDSLKRPEVKVTQLSLSWNQVEMDGYAKMAFGAFGRIDVLVNNAAYGYFGAIEETNDADVKAQFDTNFFAVLRLIRSCLPNLRQQGFGTIMNISSIGGFHSLPSHGIYCASKFALEGATEALAGEIAPFGLGAVIVEPGYFRTTFLASHAAGNHLAPQLDVYKDTIADEWRQNSVKSNGTQPGNPKLGAARMWEYVAGEGMFKGKKKLLRLPLGSDTGLYMKQHSAGLNEVIEHYEEIWKSTDYDDQLV